MLGHPRQAMSFGGTNRPHSRTEGLKSRNWNGLSENFVGSTWYRSIFLSLVPVRQRLLVGYTALVLQPACCMHWVRMHALWMPLHAPCTESGDSESTMAVSHSRSFRKRILDGEDVNDCAVSRNRCLLWDWGTGNFIMEEIYPFKTFLWFD